MLLHRLTLTCTLTEQRKSLFSAVRLRIREARPPCTSAQTRIPRPCTHACVEYAYRPARNASCNSVRPRMCGACGIWITRKDKERRAPTHMWSMRTVFVRHYVCRPCTHACGEHALRKSNARPECYARIGRNVLSPWIRLSKSTQCLKFPLLRALARRPQTSRSAAELHSSANALLPAHAPVGLCCAPAWPYNAACAPKWEQAGSYFPPHAGVGDLSQDLRACQRLSPAGLAQTRSWRRLRAVPWCVRNRTS